MLVAFNAPALEKKQYKVFIVSDTLKPKFVEVQEGIKDALNSRLAAEGAEATYTVFDTKTDPATVPGILKAIKEGNPDLICAINSPGSFADINISLKLPTFKIVSENCIPVQSGVAKSWDLPGGNITGVGVFIQLTSMLRLAKMINPQAKKLVFLSWDAMTQINGWFETEIKNACRTENIELAEFKRLPSAEDEFEYLRKVDAGGPEYFAIMGISAWAHRDGSYADMAVEEADFVQNKIKRIPLYAYDEASVKAGYPAGTCIVWYDIGAQLGEKGFEVLHGANPGDIPWEYPRKFNLMFNLKAAKSINLKIPQYLLNAAYRIYTDYDGNFIGRKN